MPLKTVVKVGNISNLSDARYCSGMGVDMLGFTTIEGQPNYLSPKLYQEIRGWVTGPKIVAEIYGITSPDQLQSIIENYAPDYLEMTEGEFTKYKEIFSLPCIVAGSGEVSEKIIYRLLTEAELNAFAFSIPVLVEPNADTDVLQLIQSKSVAGIALSGSAELRPGFKDYGDLSENLEKLDEY